MYLNKNNTIFLSFFISFFISLAGAKKAAEEPAEIDVSEGGGWGDDLGALVDLGVSVPETESKGGEDEKSVLYVIFVIFIFGFLYLFFFIMF